MNKIDGLSMDIEQVNKDKLKEVFPDCFTEGTLDIDKLLSLCGEYIDNDFEKYKFEWKGKSECLRLAQKRSTATLRPCKEESVDFDNTGNLYIEGDNLEVLKLLQTAYYRQVKMIYIDPPYNTGNDFVYEDNFKDPMSKYKEVTSQTTKSNPETMGRYHTNWLNMMYPRLRLASNLLKDDGVIFISIDDNEVHNLRKLCDEVFGEENFVGEIIWKRKRGRDNSAKWFSKAHEYLIIYAKSKNEFNVNFLELDKETIKAYKNPDNDERGVYRMLACWARGTQGGVKYEFTDKNGNYFHERLWLFSKENLTKMDNDNKLIIRGDNIYRKLFITENKGKIPETLWDNVSNAANASDEIKNLFNCIVFDTPKPIPYLTEMFKIVTDKNSNDIILDFFSGSATTAHAVMALNAEDGGNRKFICVQLPEVTDEKSEAYKAGYKNICEIGKERIRRAGQAIHNSQCIIHNEKDKQDTIHNSQCIIHNEKDKQDTIHNSQCIIHNEKGEQTSKNSDNYELSIMNYELDTGFKVFKLDTTNLIQWDSTPIKNDDIELFTKRVNEMVESVKPDREALDVIYEIILKMGVPLDIEVSYIEVNKKIVYVIGDFLLLICFAENITAEDIEAMAQYAPAKIICTEQSFKDDSALSNAFYILKDRGIEMKLV